AGTAGNVVGIGAAVLRLIGMGFHIGQVGIDAGCGQLVIRRSHIAALGKAVGCLELLGAVEVLVAVRLAHLRQCLVELVNGGLLFRGLVRTFVDRRDGIDDDVAIAVCGFQGIE